MKLLNKQYSSYMTLSLQFSFDKLTWTFSLYKQVIQKISTLNLIDALQLI